MNHKIFISHAVKDIKLVESFVNNLLKSSFDIKDEEIFCSSIYKSGIPAGNDWRGKIKNSFNECEIIILFITFNYMNSKNCLLEMGAAFFSKHKQMIPVKLPNMKHSDCGDFISATQIIDFNEEGIDQLGDMLKDYWSNFKLSTWNQEKGEFLNIVNNYKEDTPEINTNGIYNEALKSLDKNVYKEAESIFNKEFIYFLKEHHFADPFLRKDLDILIGFVRRFDDPNFCFIDEEMNKLLLDLKIISNNFNNELCAKTGWIDDERNGMSYEYKKNDEESYRKDVEILNNLSLEVYNKWCNFIRNGRIKFA